MNAPDHDARLRSAQCDLSPSQSEAPDAERHVHRDRDFGIGYGNSSGYGRTLPSLDGHFLDGHAGITRVEALFRFRFR